MTRIHPAWLAREQRRWLRPDAHRWWRPDAARFQKPQYPERKFSPDQPRIPAGNPDGGQWTSGSSGASLPSGASDGASLVEGVESDLGFDSTVQPVFWGPAVQAGRVIQTGVQAALSLFAALSAQNASSRTAVLAFRTMDFLPGASPGPPGSDVGYLTRDEVDQLCPARPVVQSLLDKAAASVNRADYSASDYGTAVHTRLRVEVEALLNPRLRAEVSLMKTLQETGSLPPGEAQIARYGQRGSLRIDVLEKAQTYTVCVHDAKTGNAVLELPRMQELAKSVIYRFPDTLRIIVIEARPRR